MTRTISKDKTAPGAEYRRLIHSIRLQKAKVTLFLMSNRTQTCPTLSFDRPDPDNQLTDFDYFPHSKGY